MTRTYKTGLLITGDAKGGVRAVQMTQRELDKLDTADKKAGEKLNTVGDGLKNVGRTLSSIQPWTAFLDCCPRAHRSSWV